MAGLTDTGFVKQTLTETDQEIKDELKSQFGAYINTLPTAFFGQLSGVMAKMYDQLWQAMLDLYNGTDPNTAAGTLLSYLTALTGITKRPATKSTVTLTVNLDASVTLPVGRLVSNPTTGVQFTTTAEVTSTTAGNYSVAAEATVTGPVAALSGSLTQIDTPVTGWNSVTNAADAVPGKDAETDAELRTRRLTSLQVQGSTPVDAISSDLSALANVTEVLILENVTDATDVNGLPPHSFEAVVEGGTDADIAQSLWDDGKAAGIQTYGTSSATVTDSEGNTQTLYFTRPTSVSVWVDVTLAKDSNYPVDGDTQVAAAVAAADSAFKIGSKLYASSLYDEVFSVAGVVDVTDIKIGLSASPTATSLTPALREKFDLDSSRVTVTS